MPPQRKFWILESEYWRLSKDLGFGAMFALPLWLLYELGVVNLNAGWAGRFRTGVDYLLTDLAQNLGLPAASSAIAVLLIFLFLIMATGRREKISSIRVRYFGGMLLESAAYASCVGILVGTLANYFLAAGFASTNQVIFPALVLGVGAGIYEELAFRVVIFSGLIFLLMKLGLHRPLVLHIWALIASSILFSSFHHLPLFGEPFTLNSYLFRFFAGAVLCLLFILRGFGVTAYTHAFYNMFLIFRTSNH